MSPFPYDQLWHYSEKFTRDQDLRQDLVLMAFEQDKRFGDRSEIRLLKHYMKLRSREITSRNSLGKDIGGKSKRDAYSRERVSIFKPIAGGNHFCLAETLTCVDRNPFSSTVVNQFGEALPELESRVAEQMISGYTQRETLQNLGITMDVLRDARSAVRERALEYLV